MHKSGFKRTPLLLLTVIITVIMLLGGCSRTGAEGQVPDAEVTSKEIVVLFTSDIHCGVNENWRMPRSLTSAAIYIKKEHRFWIRT